MSTETTGGEIREVDVPCGNIESDESFKEATSDRMISRIKKARSSQSPQSITLRDFIAEPLFNGAIFVITIGAPLAAIIQIMNRDIGTSLAGPVILASSVSGIVYGLYSEAKLRLSN